MESRSRQWMRGVETESREAMRTAGWMMPVSGGRKASWGGRAVAMEESRREAISFMTMGPGGRKGRGESRDAEKMKAGRMEEEEGEAEAEEGEMRRVRGGRRDAARAAGGTAER